ncbi:hypothetical protein NLI96_g11923 [Meripilus lineatus]|uniref:Beta-hexosaminidase n=1 Tax=Meripilus lineatus TaxID=2056292 RepID=A0AAD5YCW8_9APHY|nr:hypothetical protein NLI96_g11923 [Physisporinus lineatus]
MSTLSLLFIFLNVLFSRVAGLWPIPRSLSTGNTPVKLSPTFSIQFASDFAQGTAGIPQDLLEAIERTEMYLHNDTFERLVVGRGKTDAKVLPTAIQVHSLRLTLTEKARLRSIAEEATSTIDEKMQEGIESYALKVPEFGGGRDGGVAMLQANTSLGLLRGLQTFGQMWYAYEGTKYLLNAPIEIEDGPAFPYRGFSFDTSRNFYPIADILRTLDAMSWVKLNILYWHIIDSQSFPLEVEAFPELSAKGAYSSEEVYSLKDVDTIVKYANARGIDVIMVELDSPGHTTAVSFAHPEHVACANKSPWSRYASEPPAGQLRIASNQTVAFVKDMFGSVAKRLPGRMMSSGGDEVNLACWEEDEETSEELRAKNQTIAEALNVFVEEVQGELKENGKTPFIKSDMILTHNVPVTNDTVAVVWQSSEDAVRMAQRGIRFIHQPSNFFYLDCRGGEWLGNDVLGNSWCDPFKTWQRAYSFDPHANLTTEETRLVLGGQMPLWSEQSSGENLDSIVWPRLGAGAEVFWTGEVLPDEVNATSGGNAFLRLNELRYRLVDRNVRAIALQPKWCVLRPGECDLN